jgi:hypothetical protein
MPDINLGGALTDVLRSVALFVPRLLIFTAILVIGWAISKLLMTVVDKVLERVGFDRAVERGGIRTALARSNYDASDIVARLVYYTGLLFTLQLAFGVFGPNPVSDLIKGVIAWLPQAAVAIVIVVVAAAIARGVRDIVGNALGALSYGRMLGRIASTFILGLGVIAALNQVGIATSVTTPVLVTILATIGGIAVVGLGGGLVKPMQQRWEGWLSTAERETQTISDQARAYAAGHRDMQHAGTPTTTPTATPGMEAGRLYATAGGTAPVAPAGIGDTSATQQFRSPMAP